MVEDETKKAEASIEENGVNEPKIDVRKKEKSEKKKTPEKISEETIKELEEKEDKIIETEKERIIREKGRREKERAASELASWNPKTKLGKEVKTGKIKDLNEIIDKNRKILEPEIVDTLIETSSDLISIGQSKGKFGGGKRRAWRQTQRKTKEGNVATFSTMAVIGDSNGHMGIGSGRAKETLPARDKAVRKAKLNVIHVKRACAGFDCACSEQHTVPFEVTGKSGSVRVTLIPASQGTGLVVGDQLKKILKLSGIKDVYSRTSGRKRTTFNLIKACVEALKKTNPEVYGK